MKTLVALVTNPTHSYLRPATSTNRYSAPTAPPSVQCPSQSPHTHQYARVWRMNNRYSLLVQLLPRCSPSHTSHRTPQGASLLQKQLRRLSVLERRASQRKHKKTQNTVYTFGTSGGSIEGYLQESQFYHCSSCHPTSSMSY